MKMSQSTSIWLSFCKGKADNRATRCCFLLPFLAAVQSEQNVAQWTEWKFTLVSSKEISKLNGESCFNHYLEPKMRTILSNVSSLIRMGISLKFRIRNAWWHAQRNEVSCLAGRKLIPCTLKQEKKRPLRSKNIPKLDSNAIKQNRF